ncbi:hypothetical protein DSO57_1018190 [Entomophthora muscae]|uniref:Uncharacterized protein n=1 Tax=Entomophthora muscae TaxID=34485 RepID=A0ACC2RJ46_9FUNG|nr:hypothetical protein DSO57_1018190 [Entomophthora muscae]
MTLIPVTSLKRYHGLDAPARVARLGFSSAGCILTMLCLISKRHLIFDRLIHKKKYFFMLLGFLGSNGFTNGMKFLNTIYSSGYSKYCTSERMLDLVYNWSRVISVADMGCGQGLLTAAIAKHLSTIRPSNRDIQESYSISCVDDFECSRNKNVSRRSEFLENLLHEGVDLKHIKLYDTPLAQLTLPSDRFDLVVSALSLHKLSENGVFKETFISTTCSEMQRRALDEMVRICRPGGQILIWDMHYAHLYGQYFFIHPELTNVFVSSEFSSFGGLSCHIISARKIRTAL